MSKIDPVDVFALLLFGLFALVFLVMFFLVGG